MEYYCEEVYKGQALMKKGYFLIDNDLHELAYTIADNLAIMEGDIILGDAESIINSTAEVKKLLEVRGLTEYQRQELSLASVQCCCVPTIKKIWNNKTIPYTIDTDNVTQHFTDIVNEAIEEINKKTNLTLRPKTNSDSDYVFFETSVDQCSSWVGRVGGKQKILISNTARTGNVIHEIFHAAGFFHEQSRTDRDCFVKIIYDNIQKNKKSNFDIMATSCTIGDYDYGSIMHYGKKAFADNKNLDTIVPLSPTAIIGQRDGMSPKDISAMNRVYP